MIRHFATQGNLNKRYIGVTDESLCEAGKQIFEDINYPMADAVFASPMIRCVETLKLIYPNYFPIFYQGFAECNFGDFENKNFKELSYNPEYQAWIDSNGTLPFPNGEDPKDFKARSIAAFDKMVKISLQNRYETVALVAHGGTIMSILDKYSYPQEEYYHWQVENGNGYYAEMEENNWRLTNICTIH
jgi:alpha-ribazole phosphatase